MAAQEVTMRSSGTIAALGLAAFVSLPAVSPEPPEEGHAERTLAQVLVLGVYHMSNPGHDVINMQADDVLSPKRQAEIAQVVAALERFRPTKIAVEAGFSDDRILKHYAEYVAGKRELTRNKVEQLGFRLAKKLRHETVYPVDVGGDFPYPRLVKYVQATGRAKEFEALEQQEGESVRVLSTYLGSHSVLETLLYINSDQRVAEAVGFYFRLAESSEPWDWAGADLVSDWFRRNMRIYGNIVQLADSPNQRILIIYGAGHLGWLRHAFASNPRFLQRKLDEFAK